MKRWFLENDPPRYRAPIAPMEPPETPLHRRLRRLSAFFMYLAIGMVFAQIGIEIWREATARPALFPPAAHASVLDLEDQPVSR